MPRIARLYREEGVFHILTRGNNRQAVFKDEADFKVYKAQLEELKEEQPFKLYHYCLMSNHGKFKVSNLRLARGRPKQGK